jgi:hypothetical protein
MVLKNKIIKILPIKIEFLTVTVLAILFLAGCGQSQEEKEKLAVVACSIIKETGPMDGAIRVEKMNEVREKIGGEVFLDGDNAIKESIRWNICSSLALEDENYHQLLGNARLAAKERLEWEKNRDARELIRTHFEDIIKNIAPNTPEIICQNLAPTASDLELLNRAESLDGFVADPIKGFTNDDWDWLFNLDAIKKIDTICNIEMKKLFNPIVKKMEELKKRGY